MISKTAPLVEQPRGSVQNYKVKPNWLWDFVAPARENRQGSESGSERLNRDPIVLDKNGMNLKSAPLHAKIEGFFAKGSVLCLSL